MASPSPLREIQEALAQAFSGEEVRLLVLDDFQAHYLQALLGGYAVEGLYSYLSRQADMPIASSSDLYEAFQAALRALFPTEPPLPFLESWEYARNFTEDIREVLLSLPPHAGAQSFLRPLLTFWQEVARERHLEAIFSFQEEDIPWVGLLQLPRAYSGPTVRRLYQQISDLVGNLLRYLWYKKRKVLGEELFTKKPLRKPVVFWNIFSPERRLQAWMQYQAQEGQAYSWGWDITPLEEVIGAPLWPLGHGATALHRAFSGWEERRISLKAHFQSRARLLEEVAEALAQVPPGEWVALWVGDATLRPLLEHLLQKVRVSVPGLAPPTLLETEVGTFLRKAYSRGQVPSPDVLYKHLGLDNLTAISAEYEAARLYEYFYANPESRNVSSFGHFLRFLGRIPAPLSSVLCGSFVSGQLSQLAGGIYDKLFIVLPPAEPLGSWFRPSFVPAPLRRRHYPPALHTRTAWRLLTLLLYGARETFIYQLAGEENQSPLEEFLRYFRACADFHKLWQVEEVRAAPRLSSFEAKNGAAPLLPLPASSLNPPPSKVSPSELYTFLMCPRRYYLSRIAGLSEGPVSAGAFRGTWLHETLRAALIGLPALIAHYKGRSSGPSTLTTSLSGLQKRWASSHLFTLLRRTYARLRRRSEYAFLPPLARNPEMRFWQRVFAESGTFFYEHIRDFLCTPSLCPPDFVLYPEVWVSSPLAPNYQHTFKGRLDLLITDGGRPLLALDYKTEALSEKYAGNFAHFVKTWRAHLDWISGYDQFPKKPLSRIDFQASTYVMNFGDNFPLIVANALKKTSFLTCSLASHELSEVAALWQQSYELLVSRYGVGREVAGQSSSSQARSELERLFPMTPEKSLCGYCPFKVVCQRL